MSAVDDLRRKVQSLRDQLKDASAKLEQAELDACPVKTGMVVLGNDGKEYKVLEIDTRRKPPWLVANPKRADGSWGTARRSLFDRYTVVTTGD